MTSRVASVVLGLAVFAVTVGNRPLMVLTNDEVPQAFIPWMTLRGYGMDFAPVIAKYGSPDEPLRPYLTRAGGRVLSIYPYASGWLALPLSAPQFLWMDWKTPGWDEQGGGLLEGLRRVGKRTSAAIIAMTAFLLHRLLIAWGFGGWATAATLATVLGSNLWVVASQATWQHGPAALCLTASLWAMSPADGQRAGEGRLFLAGLFAALLAAVRLPDALLSAVIAIVALRFYRSRTFFIAPVVMGAMVIGWNAITGERVSSCP